jgi:DNA-binding GntR family transcriptional regulator
MAAVGARVRRGPTLVQQVYEAICQDLVTGRLAPGQRIVLDRLAAELGTSPTPVREALARLIQEGLIVAGPDGRLQVIDLTPEYVLDTFAVRAALEGLAAELAANRIDERLLRRLQQVIDEATAALADDRYEVYAQADDFLHRSVAEAAGNRVLQRNLKMLRVHVDFILGYSRRNIGDHLRASHTEHLRILAALRAGDPAGARRAMEDHIRAAGRRIAELIDFTGRIPRTKED